jgi:hypothetical protein
MRPRPVIAQTYRRYTKLACLVVCLTLGSFTAFANESKVVIRENIQRVHHDVLTLKLREITGWSDLGFDQNGLLQLGVSEPSRGSSGARKLLTRAVSGQSLIVLEDASSRTDVAFCKVVQAKWLQADASAPPVFIVLLDFADFEKVMGDRQARAAGAGTRSGRDRSGNGSPQGPYDGSPPIPPAIRTSRTRHSLGTGAHRRLTRPFTGPSPGLTAADRPRPAPAGSR